jgi:DNA-binding transcriptional LysR family regulator
MSTPLLPPSLVQLLSFVRVAEAGSFSEAARRSNCSTSAMSKAVSRLEQAHGVRLLNRTTHSLSLTPEGDHLLAVGQRLLAEVEVAEEAFAELGHRGESGRVRISAPPSFAKRCLMPGLPEFLNANPGISLEVEFTNDFLNMGVRGIDFAIGGGNLAGFPGHSARKLCTFPWIVCASPKYFQKYGTPRTPAELSGHKLIGFRNRVTGQLDTWRFRNPADGTVVRHAPTPAHTFDDPEAAWEMIRAGLGIGYGPAWMGTHDWQSGTVVETLRDWRSAEVPLHLVRLDKRMTPKRVHAVQKFVVDRTRAWRDSFARSGTGVPRSRAGKEG